VSGPTETYQGASAEAIQHHYDLGNDFYALWLDPSKTYSCALWDGDDDTLEAAQMRKLDYLIAGAQAAGTQRVLDVGCGWGSLMKRLVDEHGVQSVTGLSLSEAQVASVQGWADERYDVRLENWADHQPEQPYDAIISIGAFEHFADYGMQREDRVASYQRFFTRCREWLPTGGRLALQTISKGSNVQLDRHAVRELLFVIEKIFPESELPWFSELLEGSERRFEVVNARNDAPMYARTCQAWLDNLTANREQAVAMVGEPAVVDYERYLAASVFCFERRHVGLLRVILEAV
jgi:cyclopropane-fatty-acyl-phospholipid synthase